MQNKINHYGSVFVCCLLGMASGVVGTRIFGGAPGKSEGVVPGSASDAKSENRDAKPENTSGVSDAVMVEK
jgi:hypothetical protein